MTPDDFHMAVRVVTSADTINLYGYLYVTTGDGMADGIPTEMMTDYDRL